MPVQGTTDNDQILTFKNDMIGRRKSSLRKYNFDYDQQKKLINSLFLS